MKKNEMEKATAAVEDIFSHAVALTQANRLKNTIYCKEKDIYILNFDNTVLLRFGLPSWEKPFKNPISFHGNDYDSNTFYEEDGKIVFISEVGGVERKKSISAPGATPDEIAEMFDRYEPLDSCSITFHQKIIEALDEKLSHIEISVRDGEWKLIQRDIYSGSIIELTELKKGLKMGGKIKDDIGPIGIRTNDFIALFSFQDRITVHFDPEYREYASVTGKNYDMEGVLAFCMYDEIGDITPTKPKNGDDGEEKPKTGRSRRNLKDEPEGEEKPKRGRRSSKKEEPEEEKPKRGRSRRNLKTGDESEEKPKRRRKGRRSR